MTMNANSMNSSILQNESVVADFRNILQDGNLTEKHANNDTIQLLQTPPPILEFVMQVNTKVCRLAESTLPASVFRKHLILAKDEENVLAKLQNYTSSSLSANNSHLSLTAGLDACSNVDNESRINLFPKPLNKTEQFQVASIELSEENTISFEDVISHPMLSQNGKVLVCLNAALPVLSYSKETYYLSTVIEDPMSLTKVARLEVVCDFHEAESLSRSLKNPFLHAMEPGSLILLHDPIFKYDFSGETLSICVNKIKDVVFHGHVSPFPLKTESMIQTAIKYENGSKISATLLNENFKKEESKESLWAPTSTCEEMYARDEWKEWGNKKSVLRKHSQALIAYTIALRFDTMSIELVSAKCASLVNLGLFTSALKEVDSIISQDPFNTGLILRKTHCLWGLGMYDEAIDYLKHNLEKLSIKSIRSQYTEDECARKRYYIQNIISKTEKMIRQSTTLKLSESGVMCKNQTQLSCMEPEYYAPISLIFKSTDGNEGISSYKRKIAVTNQAVPAGMLLAKIKAFSVVFQEETEGTRQDSHNDELINLTMQKLLFEKTTEMQFDDLREKESSSNYSILLAHSTAELSKSSITKFYEKYLYESNNDHFAEVSVEHEQTNNDNDDEACLQPRSRTNTSVRGLWTFPANVRHVCVGGNVIWYISGSFMFLRAICDIKHGEEILMAHVDPTKSFEFRQSLLNKKGMNCFCSLCQFEKTEPETTKMRINQLLKDIKGLNDNMCSKDFCYLQTRRLKHCLDDLDILRSAYARLNFPIVEPYYNFGFYLMKTGSFEEAINAFEKAFFVVDNTAVIFLLLNISFLLSYCYMAKKKNADKIRSRKWFAAAESYAKISYGSLNPVKNKFKVEFEYLKNKNIIL